MKRIKKVVDSNSDIVKNKMIQLGFTPTRKGITAITNRIHQEYISNLTYDKDSFVEIMDKVSEFLEDMGRGTTFNGGLGKDNKIYLVIDIDNSRVKDKSTIKDLQPVGMNGMFSINCRKIQEAEKLYRNNKFQEAEQKFENALYSTYDSGILTNNGISTVANKKLAKQWLDKYDVIGILQKHPKYNDAKNQILTRLNSLNDVDNTKVSDKLIQSSSKEALQKNIEQEIKSGKDPKQAAAIAYSVQRTNDTMYKTIRDYPHRYCVVLKQNFDRFAYDANIESVYDTMEEAQRNKAMLEQRYHKPMLIVNEGAIYDNDTSFDSSIKDELGYKPEFRPGMQFNDLEDIVHNTIKYIKQKYPNEQNTMEKWLTLIGEEFGELCQAINDGEVNNVIEEGTQTISAIYLMLSDFIINCKIKPNNTEE